MMKTVFPSTTWTAVVFAVLSVISLSDASIADSAVFGSGSNTFNMEFVTISNVNNLDDTTGDPNPVGSVAYEYNIGKFEVSEGMITKYNANFGTANNLAINTDGRGAGRPATNVSWNEAARFVNWLNTSTGFFAAYKFTTTGVNDNITPWTAADTLDYDASNPYRSIRTNYVLPSMDEWYKAAFYDPNTGLYFNFPTASDSAPTAVSSGTGTDTAVYNGQAGPANIMAAGGLSPYGVMGLGGNVIELQETSATLVNNSGASRRMTRGGSFVNPFGDLASDVWFDTAAMSRLDIVGFRVVQLRSVPEPSSLVLAFIGISALVYRRRMKKLL